MEINTEIIKKILELANKDIEIENVTEDDIKKALINLERKLNFYADSTIMNSEMKLNLLIVDDLELSIFQFSNLLEKIGTKPSVARTKEEAIAEIKKKNFDFLVIDLFLPDLNDGISLIKEAVKYRNENNQNYKIIAISSTDDMEIIKQVYYLGIDEFIPKSEKWHLEIVKYIANNYKHSENSNFSMFVCEDDICVYTIQKLNTEKQKKDLIQDITKSLYLSKSNIVLNVENIRNFNEDYTSVFSEIYKLCNDIGGNFVIVSPTKEISDALKDCFLDDLIKTTSSINEAITTLKNKN